jgi:hypothetical protein
VPLEKGILPNPRERDFGKPPNDLLYHPPRAPIVYVDTMIMHAGRVAVTRSL